MTITLQMASLLAMVAAGIWVGLSVDTYKRIWRHYIRNMWMKGLHDIIFWVLQGVLVFFLLWHVNYGELRFYLLLAMLLGVSMYQTLLKRAYLTMLNALLSCILTLVRILRQACLLLIIRPIVWVASVIWAIIAFIVGGIGKILYHLLRIVFFLPIRWGLLLIWRLLPIKTRQHFVVVAGKCMSFKNTITQLVKKLRK
ncbi:spore cortex biosynthesis protein YabQ [Aureibacillus halotolerans]|uniref:Spore cortex biosynthesis protein YabQ n=1 Tax=Aureibacillus halotolerans TaxID=1508390 RepID=A0A4R6TPV0_9BACI|nr:spore cortex biosynthesis protein YabQ [Aureibacillus halotolerans]TDQ34219.1 spore cortex biosynthesis protein YabQ [Aureibacillus halotolerans]